MKNILKNIFAGFTMGVANVIPGVSGGTMALITGVFDTIIDAIQQFTSRETWQRVKTFRVKELLTTLPWLFLISLGVGILIAFATTARLMLYLLENHQVLTYAFFLGLIVASLVPVARRVKSWNVPRGVSLFAGTVAGFLVVTLVPVSTPDTWWMLMLVGAISFCAMILPGISGSFLLLIFGKYDAMWGAVANVTSGKITTPDLLTLMWIALGGLLGIILFAHMVFLLLKRFHDTTLAALMGLMVGSLWKLWPWQHVVKSVVRADGKVNVLVTQNYWPWDSAPASQLLYALLCFILGALLVGLTERFAGGKK